MTEMVWIVTQASGDDRKVVKGVYRFADSAYRRASVITCGMTDAEAQGVSVMGHRVQGSASDGH
jgi:hypothetical protein